MGEVINFDKNRKIVNQRRLNTAIKDLSEASKCREITEEYSFLDYRENSQGIDFANMTGAIQPKESYFFDDPIGPTLEAYLEDVREYLKEPYCCKVRLFEKITHIMNVIESL